MKLVALRGNGYDDLFHCGQIAGSHLGSSRLHKELLSLEELAGVARLVDSFAPAFSEEVWL